MDDWIKCATTKCQRSKYLTILNIFSVAVLSWGSIFRNVGSFLLGLPYPWWRYQMETLIIITYVCALLKPPTRGVCDGYCNCTPIVVNKICLKQMETFSTLLAICAGNSPIPGEFPTQRPVTRSFDVYFDLRPNKRLSKQLWGWWFETQSRQLWRHRNASLSLQHCDAGRRTRPMTSLHHCPLPFTHISALDIPTTM